MTRTVFAVALIALLVVPTFASAATHGIDTAFRHERRSLTFETMTDGFRGESLRTSELGDDEFVARYFLDDGLLRLRYVSTEPGNQTVLTLDIAFVGLVEFEDTNGDGRFGFDDDVVQRVPLTAMEGATLTSEPFLTGGHAARASYSFPNRSSESGGNGSVPPLDDDQPALLPGTFELRFYMVPSTQRFGGDELAPLDLKYDVMIDRFPYQESGTRIALEQRLTASEGIGEAAFRERAVESGSGYLRTYLGWARTAEVDTAPRPVQVSTLSYAPSADDTSESVVMAFAYPRGEQIVHDPQAGVVRYQGVIADTVRMLVEGNWLLYSLGLAVALVAVGVPAGIRLRRGP